MVRHGTLARACAASAALAIWLGQGSALASAPLERIGASAGQAAALPSQAVAPAPAKGPEGGAAPCAPGAAPVAPRLEAGEADFHCPDPRAIACAVCRLAAPAVPEHEECVLDLAQVAPGYVTLKLACRTERFERALPFSRDDCRELAPAAAVVVQSWLRHLPGEPPPPPPVAEVREVILPAPPPALERARPPSHRARLSALSGASAQASLSPRPAGLLMLEWQARPAWGLGLAAGVSGAWTGSAFDREVRVLPFWVAALGSLRLAHDEVQRLDLLAGPSLHLLYARATTRGGAPSHSGIEPSVTAAVRWMRRLGSGFSAAAALELSARNGATRFVVEREERGDRQSKTALAVPAERVLLLVGATWGAD